MGIVLVYKGLTYCEGGGGGEGEKWLGFRVFKHFKIPRTKINLSPHISLTIMAGEKRISELESDNSLLQK